MSETLDRTVFKGDDGPMTTNERHLVYTGICAVAAHCDGALMLDGVGFRGQDTAFGRRIASVPFEDWTEDVHEEAAKLATIYQAQILNYTGVDVTTLAVVRAAQNNGTNYTARNDARRYERRAKGANLITERSVALVGEKLAFTWAKGDPDFAALLDAIKVLPGRRFDWDTKANVTDVTTAAIEFAGQWLFALPAGVAELATRPTFNIGVLKGSDGKRLWINAPYVADRVPEARALPGRRWNGAQKLDEVDASSEVLAFAERWGLSISPKAQAAINGAGEERLDATAPARPRAIVLAEASRATDPDRLSADFEALVREALR